MKIIGESGRDLFITIASKQELANLLGYYSEYSVKRAFKAGDEIMIHPIFRQLYDLKFKENALDKLAKELEDLAKLLRLKNPVMRASAEGITKAFEEIKE